MREMAGLSILLEGYQKKTASVANQNPQVISKTLSIKPPSPPPPPPSSSLYSSPLPAVTFLDSCFLCKQRLLPGNDIYMYKGDRAFCSVECRCRQIFMDEECVSVGNGLERNCSFSARKPINGKSTSTSTSTSSSRRRTQGNKNRSDWFIY